MTDSKGTLPKYLYHYTSQKGLLGILKDRKLWMTNIMYLNDSLEYTYCLNIAQIELDKLKKSTLKETNGRLISGEEKKDHDMLLSYYYSVEHYIKALMKHSSGGYFFVFSFSQMKDDISQWRGYCPEVGGYCIEFDTNKLLSTLNILNQLHIRCYFQKCIYEQNKVKLSVNSIFKKYIALLKSPKYDYIIASVGTAESLYEISTHVKDDSFKNEKEYRLVYKTEGSFEKAKYREGKSMIVPYIDVDFSLDKPRLPINKIWIGPTPHPELSKLSIENLLKSEKHETVKVEISKIPYRSW